MSAVTDFNNLRVMKEGLLDALEYIDNKFADARDYGDVIPDEEAAAMKAAYAKMTEELREVKYLLEGYDFS